MSLNNLAMVIIKIPMLSPWVGSGINESKRSTSLCRGRKENPL